MAGPSNQRHSGRFRLVTQCWDCGATPVAAEKIVSPSIGACEGRNARAMPSCRHNGKTLGLRFGQRRVSGDDGYGGIFRGIALM